VFSYQTFPVDVEYVFRSQFVELVFECDAAEFDFHFPHDGVCDYHLPRDVMFLMDWT
jgi:hypothetical protein